MMSKSTSKTSDVAGVRYNPKAKKNKWSARTTVDGTRMRLGSFKTKEEAEFAVGFAHTTNDLNSFDDIPTPEPIATKPTRSFRSWKPSLLSRVTDSLKDKYQTAKLFVWDVREIWRQARDDDKRNG